MAHLCLVLQGRWQSAAHIWKGCRGSVPARGEREAEGVTVPPSWWVPRRHGEMPSSSPEAGSEAGPSSSETTSVISGVARGCGCSRGRRCAVLLWAVKQKDASPCLGPRAGFHRRQHRCALGNAFCSEQVRLSSGTMHFTAPSLLPVHAVGLQGGHRAPLFPPPATALGTKLHSSCSKKKQRKKEK